jgi:hypothetical protein
VRRADRFTTPSLLVCLAAVCGCKSNRQHEPTARSHGASASAAAGAARATSRPSSQPIFGTGDATAQAPQTSVIRGPRLAPDPVVRSGEGAIKVPEKSYPVKEGTPPLVYMLESDAIVEVIDTGTGASVATAQLPRRTIVSVDATRGVRAGGQTLSTAPLNAGHMYQIFVRNPEQILGQDNRFRSTVVEPGSGGGR